MRRRIAMLGRVVWLSGCVVHPDLSHLPPPCAAGYHPDPTGTMCLLGPALVDSGASDSATLDAGSDAATDGGTDRCRCRTGSRFRTARSRERVPRAWS